MLEVPDKVAFDLVEEKVVVEEPAIDDLGIGMVVT